MIFDTLKLSQALKGEFTSAQAEALASALAANTQDAVATKSDLTELKIELVRWIVGAIAFNLLGTIGIMITVAELVLKSR